MSTQTDANKALIRRLVDEVFNGGNLHVIDQFYAPDQVMSAKKWIGSFQASFPDMHMDIVELVAEDDTVMGRFTCSATHTGMWRGYEPTGRRFNAISEVNRYRIRNDRITDTWTLEDDLERFIQLGILPATVKGY